MSKIFLDFGHGGSDTGAVYGGLIERDINLIVGTSCANELERYGVSVRKSRTTNGEAPSLAARCDMANKWVADYFVSIHCNAGGGDRGEVIHSIWRGKGLQLSNNIADEMKNHGQSVVKEYDKRGDDNKDYFAVIRGTSMDSVIVECAFLDNETDNDIIDTYAEQVAFGVAIARGILRQLGITVKEEKPKKYYVITNYLQEGSFGVELNAIRAQYFYDIDRLYIRRNEKGIWIETQYLSKEKCLELKARLGNLFWEIKEE